MQKIVKIADYICKNYMWFLLLNGIIFITFKSLAVFEYLIFPLISYFLFFKKRRIVYANIFDSLIIFDFILICWTWIINIGNFSPMLIIRCFLSQIAYMLFYFSGRDFDYKIILEKAIYPLLICSIIGIYWYFNPPGWYIAKALSSDSYNGSMTTYLELMRLRAFYPSPYEMAYMCFFVVTYLIINCTLKKRCSKKELMCMSIFIITIILCMMRAPIAMLIFTLLFSFVYQIIAYKSKKVFAIMLAIAVVVIIIFNYVQDTIDLNSLQYITRKIEMITESEESFLLSRISTDDINISFFGDGTGRYSIFAETYGETSIRDSEYLKMIAEQGVIGISIFILLILLAVCKVIKYIKYLPLEFCILVFYIITMFGANSISTPDKHCFFFWLVIGKIATFKKNKSNIPIY